MIALKIVVAVYVVGLLLTALWASRAYWNKKALLTHDQLLARRIACVFVSLFWFAFFPKAVAGTVIKVLAKG